MHTGPSQDFDARVVRIVNELASSHPDVRVRQLIARQQFEVKGKPSAYDYAIVRGGQRNDGILVGYHVPPNVDRDGERTVIFESGVRALASTTGMSLDQAIEANALHEAEHAGGFCPDGHTDCSAEEIRATLAAGGTLTRAQTRGAAQWHDGQAATMPHWTYEVAPQVVPGCG